MLDVAQGVQHRLQMAAGELVVKILAEGLQVDIGGIHELEKFLARFFADVAGGDRHGFDTLPLTGDGRVHRVFEKNHRVVVGVGHAATTQLLRGVGQHLGRGAVGQGIHFA